MRQPKKWFLIIIFSIISTGGFSQSEDELGSWFIYNEFFNITPKIEVFFESQLRTYEIFSNPETFFLRPYFNYNVTKQLQTGIGIEYHKTWTYDQNADNKVSANEIRYTLQAMLFQKVDRVAIQHRYRYEFRDVDQDFLQRMRYRLQLTIPINNNAIKQGTVFFNLFNEFLIDTKPELMLSQDRVYGAFGYQFTEYLNFQVGYMAVFRSTTTHSRLQFFLTHKFFFYN